MRSSLRRSRRSRTIDARRSRSADKRDIDSVRWGARHAVDYLRGFVEEVRAKPNDKLGSSIVHGKIDGRPLTDDEIMGMLFLMVLAGSIVFRQLLR